MSSCPALLGNAWLQPPSISMVFCWTCLINVFFNLGDTKLKSKHGLMSVEQQESIISFSLCVVLLLTPRRMPFAFFPPRHTGLTCDFRSAAALGTCSAELLPCQSIPSVHHSQPFCLPRDMTSQLSLLNFIGLLLARSSLSSSNWMSALLLSILTDIPSSVSSAHLVMVHCLFLHIIDKEVKWDRLQDNPCGTLLLTSLQVEYDPLTTTPWTQLPNWLVGLGRGRETLVRQIMNNLCWKCWVFHYPNLTDSEVFPNSGFLPD